MAASKKAVKQFGANYEPVQVNKVLMPQLRALAKSLDVPLGWVVSAALAEGLSNEAAIRTRVEQARNAKNALVGL